MKDDDDWVSAAVEALQAPTATKPDRGPCTIYLETTTGGRFLRKLGTCDAAGSFATTTAGWPSGTSGGVALPLRVG